MLATKTKEYKKRIHSSTKLTPVQTSSKKNEGFAYNNILDKPKRIKAKLQVNDLVRTADLKKLFSKRDTINWSNKLYKITEIFNDTIPSYRFDNLPERYKESL